MGHTTFLTICFADIPGMRDVRFRNHRIPGSERRHKRYDRTLADILEQSCVRHLFQISDLSPYPIFPYFRCRGKNIIAHQFASPRASRAKDPVSRLIPARFAIVELMDAQCSAIHIFGRDRSSTQRRIRR